MYSEFQNIVTLQNQSFCRLFLNMFDILVNMLLKTWTPQQLSISNVYACFSIDNDYKVQIESIKCSSSRSNRSIKWLYIFQFCPSEILNWMLRLLGTKVNSSNM